MPVVLVLVLTLLSPVGEREQRTMTFNPYAELYTYTIDDLRGVV